MIKIAICDNEYQTAVEIEQWITTISEKRFIEADTDVFSDGEELIHEIERIDLLSDASGEEVDALREQLETENNLAIALCNTLTKFSNSIRFAASEFTELDSTGASQMGNK